MKYLITTTFAVFSLVGVASSCPSVCICADFTQGLTVDCSNRGLVSIPGDIPISTYVLDLSSNYIAKIERDTLNLPVLHQIDLSGNRITRVEAWFSSGMPNISVIDMSDNIISFISEKAFQNTTEQPYITLTMFCGCNDNFPLWKWLRVTRKLMTSLSCYDYRETCLFELVPRDFYECSEAPSTTSTPASRTTITTTSAARITRKKLDATIFDSRGLIAIAIGAGSLAAVIVLIFVIWRLRIRSKEIKKINLNRNQTRLKA